MPYGEESAYAAQAALKKKSPAYKKSSGFKMTGSPHKTGIIEGTSGHASALKLSQPGWTGADSRLGAATSAGAERMHDIYRGSEEGSKWRYAFNPEQQRSLKENISLGELAAPPPEVEGEEEKNIFTGDFRTGGTHAGAPGSSKLGRIGLGMRRKRVDYNY